MLLKIPAAESENLMVKNYYFCIYEGIGSLFLFNNPFPEFMRSTYLVTSYSFYFGLHVNSVPFKLNWFGRIH